jgi:hypothetical protein
VLPTTLVVPYGHGMTKPQRTHGGASEVEENVRVVARMIMAARGVKPAELALRLGVSRTAIFNRLGGHKPFTLAEVGIMAQFLDVPAAVFLAGPATLIRSAAVVSSPSGTPMRPKVPRTVGVSAARPAAAPTRLRLVA